MDCWNLSLSGFVGVANALCCRHGMVGLLGFAYHSHCRLLGVDLKIAKYIDPNTKQEGFLVYLRDFDYYSPNSLTEACQLLGEFGARAKILAGGTDLLHQMKQGKAAPEAVISLKGLGELTGINYEKERGVVIGARVSQKEIANSPLIKERYRSLCTAAQNMANNQIRHRGTVGGNIVNAVPSADLPPILIALDARVKLVSLRGEHVVPLEEFFLGVHQTVLREDEILTEVIIPDQPITGSTYIRFGLRSSGALAVVGVAVAVNMFEDTCKNARIALGAAAPVPMRAKQAEEILKNTQVTAEHLEEAGVAAAREARPRSSIRGSAEYRRDLIRVLTRRALNTAIQAGHV